MTDRITVLAASIKKNNEAYWTNHAPVISDEAYDLLVEELRTLDSRHPILRGFGERAPVDGGVKHLTPMLSLGKVYDDAGLEKWMAGITGGFVVQPKLDGISLELKYGDLGALCEASTRGDGDVGESVFRNIEYVTSIPKTILAPGTIIRGEIYMPRSIFAKKYAVKFANSRNIVSGAIMRKTADQDVLADLRFAAYDHPTHRFASDSERLRWIAGMGFEVAQYVTTTTTKDALVVVNSMRSGRDSFDVDLDGIVVKANSLAERDRLGATGHHPKWALALKFQGDSGTTVIHNIRWQTSRTGVITPVAEFEPVTLSGASVTDATLHHAGRLLAMSLAKGDTIEVTRRGGVIPHVERRVTSAGKRASTFGLPVTCPSCEGAVGLRGDFLSCLNSDCNAIKAGRLEHWCKVTGMLGFGPAICDALISEHNVKTIADLYFPGARTTQGLKCSAVSDKVSKKLYAEVDKTKVLPLDTFMRGLGIDTLGHEVSEKLLAHYGTIDKLRRTCAADLMKIEGVGATIAASVMDGLGLNETLIDRLLEYITISEPETKAAAKGPLLGKSFVFTGTVEGFTRESAQEAVSKLGATCPSGVTKTTTHFVIGDNAGENKRKKADDYNAKGASIQVLSSNEFLALLKSVS